MSKLNKLNHLVLIFLFISALHAQSSPLIEPIFDVPSQAQFVDLIGKGAKSGRSDAGDAIFKPGSLEALLTHKGQFIIGSEPEILTLKEPVTSLLLLVDSEKSDVVVEMIAFRGEHGLGSHLFTMDEKSRSSSVAASEGVIGLRSREPYDRIELRVAHAPEGKSEIRLDVAWAEVATKSENRGSAGNDIATLCQTPLGIAHNIAFGASLVPGSGVLAQGTAYATNIALKWCLTYIDPPDSKTIRVPPGVCEVEFEQPHMSYQYENILGASLGSNSNWGDLGSPTVYHHNTEVDVVLLYNQPTPEIAPSLDLGFWAESGSFEATDKIYEDCRDDGSVRFSQLNGTGPRYECPYVDERLLSFPVGDRQLRWRVNARMSPLDLFSPLIPGIPPGAKAQPWKGLLINVIREAILIANDTVFFSGWRINNARDVFQFIRVYDEVPPEIDPQPFNDERIQAELVNGIIHVQIEADEPGGVSANNYKRILEQMFRVTDTCGRDTTFGASYPEENLRIFWPVSTTSTDQTFDITWTAKDLGPNLMGERNETIATMTVEVVDIRPPAIVPPPDIVEVGTNLVSNLGQPLVFDFVDLSPVISNDATLPLTTGLHEVTWTATDASGNSTTAIQIVNIKNSNNEPAPIAQIGVNRQEAVTFEPKTIRLEGNDPDNDPLQFYVEQYPENGFFIAPLYPYFVEDFRLQAAPGEADDQTIRDTCQNGQGTSRNFDLPFPLGAVKFDVGDNGRSYMVDNGLVNCQAGDPDVYSLQQRVVRFGPSGEIEFSTMTNDDDFVDLLVDEFNDRIVGTRDLGGQDRSGVTIFDLELNEISDFNLRNLSERGPDGSAHSCTINLPHNTCEIPNALSAVVDANNLLYVMQENGRIYVLEESIIFNNLPLVVGVVSDDVTNIASTALDAGALALDGEGNLYASRNNRVYKYSPSWIDDNGFAQMGSFVGWLGRCDFDLAPGDEAVCDTFNKRSVGYSCTDATCGIDPIISQEERDFCGYDFTNNGNFGCRPGQFRGSEGIDVDPRGTLYVADVGNSRIQRFTTDGFFAGEAESECDGSCFVLGDFGTPQDVSANADRFYIFDPDTDLLHISLLTPFTGQGVDWAELVYQSNNEFACQNSANCIDQFAFSVSDGIRDAESGQPIRSSTANVEVEVMRNFRPPVATPGIAIVLDEDTTTAITLDGSDLDTLDNLSFSISTNPKYGSVQITGNQATYTPNPNFFSTVETPESFSFTVGDGVFVSDPEEVILTVAEINDSPMAMPPDDTTVGVGFIYRLNAEFNDPDPDEQHRLVVNWGDGTIENETAVNGGGPEVGQSGNGVGTITGEHIYSLPGNYTVELCLADRVVGDDGSETPTSESLIGCGSFLVDAIDGLDLVMSKQAQSERALPNELINVQFNVLNDPPTAGPASTATSVELSVDLPDGLIPGSISVNGNGCSLSGLQVTCNIGTLSPGFSSGADITARVDANASVGTVLAFTAQATLDQVDVSPNNEVAHVFNVIPVADLYVDAVEDGFLDKPDINHGDGICESEDGVCTLRAAIDESNAMPGQQVISLGSGVYTIEEFISLESTDDLVLIGNGAPQSIIDGSNGGGYVFIISNDSTLRIEDITIARGRIRATDGNLVMRRSRITGGAADGAVGGAINAGGMIDIRDSLIDGNRAFSGGAIWSWPQGSINSILENVTITGNQGGGLYLGAGNYTLNHVTITGNSVDTGGASGISGGALTVANSATTTITGSVLAGNYQPPGLLDVPFNCAVEGTATLTSNGNNMFGDLTGCNVATQNSDIQIADNKTKLSPLKTLGNTAPYLEPRSDSPTIDAISGGGCPAFDARGLARPQDGDGDGTASCDIGAVEYLPPQIQASIADINFGDIPVNNISMPFTIIITNSGGQDITLDTITIIGPDGEAFELSVLGDECTGTTLPSSGQCQFEITFTPMQEGLFQAAVRVSEGSQAPDAVIELSGSSGVIFFDGFEGS